MQRKLSIYDFDLTISISHTFSGASIEEFMLGGQKAGQNPYAEGRKDAHSNIKKGIESRFVHGVDHISAIATFHNNPNYIAGYVSALLCKELDLMRTCKSQSAVAVTVNVYRVEDSNIPFLISYIPEMHDAFELQKNALKNKNLQISFLQALLASQNLITAESSIDFYDDTVGNFYAAKALNKRYRINCYHVSGLNPELSIIDSSLVSPLNSQAGQTLFAQARKTPLSEPTQKASPRKIAMNEFIDLSKMGYEAHQIERESMEEDGMSLPRYE